MILDIIQADVANLCKRYRYDFSKPSAIPWQQPQKYVVIDLAVNSTETGGVTDGLSVPT